MSFRNVKIVGIGVDPALYHAPQTAIRGDRHFIVSPSMLREFGQCPARWLAGYRAPDSDAKDYGSLLDCLTLTPGDFSKRYAIQPPNYKSEKGDKPWHNGATVCKEWNAGQEALGKKIVTEAELAEVHEALARLQQDNILDAFGDASDKQVHLSGEWLDAEAGLVIPCRCLIDYVPRTDTEFAECAGDLKTTRSAHPLAWQKWSSQRGYHLQGAFDLDMLNALPDAPRRDKWCFVVQENYPPWQTARRMLDEGKLNIGRVMYQALLARYARCLATGVWEDYDPGGPDCPQGWRLDYATKWDEMEAMAIMPELVVPPDPFEHDQNDILTP